VSRFVPLEKLINPESAAYKKQGLAWQEFDPTEKLLVCPLLFTMPVVRDKNRATAGLAEEEWKKWTKG
jgi:arsenate reductase-like glutaredoxin family protein